MATPSKKRSQTRRTCNLVPTPESSTKTDWQFADALDAAPRSRMLTEPHARLAGGYAADRVLLGAGSDHGFLAMRGLYLLPGSSSSTAARAVGSLHGENVRRDLGGVARMAAPVRLAP
jgi:hypothetical protein